jgi:hypothetical protein
MQLDSLPKVCPEDPRNLFGAKQHEQGDSGSFQRQVHDKYLFVHWNTLVITAIFDKVEQ